MNELEDAFEFDEPFSARYKEREHEAKGFIPSTPRGPTDPWRGGIEKKMGWVIVGESLLSARVIVPGVGADFLSIGICTEPRSGCTLIPLTPQARIRSTHRTIPEREREKGRERRENYSWDARNCCISRSAVNIGEGLSGKKKEKNLSQGQIHVVASLNLAR